MQPGHCSFLTCRFGGRLHGGILGIHICTAISSVKSQNFRVQEPAFGFGPKLGGFHVCWKDEYGLR